MITPNAFRSQLIDAPQFWHDFNQGPWLQSQLDARLAPWWSRFFGYHMLKLGGLSISLDSQDCSIAHQVCVARTHPHRQITADPYQLPFVGKSFDAVLLLHQLEFSQDPHRLLREIDRVMMDDGYLVLAGWNPVSGMGLNRLLPWKRKRCPWHGRFFTQGRIEDWLALLNFEVVHREHFGVCAGAHPSRWRERFDQQLSPWLPLLASNYLLIARKRTIPLNKVRPRLMASRRPVVVVSNYRVQAKRQSSAEP
ncbi:methyltransferase domain-containing protein [Vibrio stylophorae]|uniref:methyltransferase domain-containing protein n=1 Tax=Vibrio stylophorae TaxID=659351 RepID=UPI001F191E0D|nr:methyltransferase domain-containing protein [Vibrio stylophorae]